MRAATSADWDAALALAQTHDDVDAGIPCNTTRSGCGVDTLILARNAPTSAILNYNDATGRLIGAADQLTDEVPDPSECSATEVIAGQNAPPCENVVYRDHCSSGDEDAGT